MKSIVILLAMIISLNAFSQVAVPVKRGEPAKFDGVLITEEKVKELYKAEQSNIVLNDLRLSDKQLSEHYKELSEDAQKSANRAKIESYWSGTVGFTLGVLISCFAFKIVQETTK